MNDDIGKVRWYGESWGAPINEDCPQTQTPVGTKCADCPRLIEADDQGVCIIYATSDIAEINRLLDTTPPQIAIIDTVPRFVYHLECWLDHILGRAADGQSLHPHRR